MIFTTVVDMITDMSHIDERFFVFLIFSLFLTREIRVRGQKVLYPVNAQKIKNIRKRHTLQYRKITKKKIDCSFAPQQRSYEKQFIESVQDNVKNFFFPKISQKLKDLRCIMEINHPKFHSFRTIPASPVSTTAYGR